MSPSPQNASRLRSRRAMSGRPSFCHRIFLGRAGSRADRTDQAPDSSQARPVTDCCRSAPADEAPEADPSRIALHFDSKAIQRDPSELSEPAPISARLLHLLGDVGDIHPSVLDLGCGDGSGAIRFLQGGARSVTGIDVSPASINIARRRAVRSGPGSERARFAVADVASVPLQRHDWVLLDRVICCYGDPDRLVANPLTAASRRFAFSVPESRGWRGVLNAIGWRAEHLWKSIVSPNRFRGYVHDVKSIEQHLEAAGFHKLRSGRGGLWYAAVFERGTSPDPATTEAESRRG